MGQKAGQGGTLLCHARWFHAVHLQGLTGRRLMPLTGLREIREAVLGAAFPRGPKDLVVHDEHDGHGDVECHGGGVDGVAEVLTDQAHPTRVDILSPTTEGW